MKHIYLREKRRAREKNKADLYENKLYQFIQVKMGILIAATTELAKWDYSHRTFSIVLVLSNIIWYTQHVKIILHFKHFQWSNPIAGELIHWIPINWQGRLKTD